MVWPVSLLTATGHAPHRVQVTCRRTCLGGAFDFRSALGLSTLGKGHHAVHHPPVASCGFSGFSRHFDTWFWLRLGGLILFPVDKHVLNFCNFWGTFRVVGILFCKNKMF